MYRVSRDQSGLTIATAEMPHMTSVSVGLWVAVGGRYEPAKLCGASHFIEHMLFKGTAKRSAAEISQAVEGVGGYLNAFTTEEATCFYSKACADRFDDLLEVLADMFLNSKFDPLEINKERHVIKEELAMYLDQPQQHVQELLNETMWPDHPLGRSLTGTPETLDAMGRAELVEFLATNYVAENAVITVAGNITHDAVMKSVRKFARKFRVNRPAAFEAAKENQREPKIRLHTKETEQTQIALGVRVCSRHDEERHALRLLNTILGENMSSRLFQIVREDHGLAYNICSSVSLLEDTGALVISAGLDTERTPKALKLITRELTNLSTIAPSQGELRRARDYVIGQLDLSLENTEHHMMWIGEQYLGYKKIDGPEKIKRRLARVTAAEIRAVAKKFFQPERLSLALVSPLDSAAGFGRLLARVR